MYNLRLATATLILAASCTGAIGDGSSSDPDQQNPDDMSGPGGGPGPGSGTLMPTPLPEGPITQVAPSRVRRLTVLEIMNSIRDAVFAGAAFTTVNQLPPEDYADVHYDNNVDELTITADFMQSLQDLSEELGGRVAQELARFLPCDAAAMGEAACSQRFVALY